MAAHTGTAVDVNRRRWLTWLLGTSFGATIASFLYPVARYVIPPATSEPSQSEVELDIKPSDLAPGSARIVPFAGKAILLLKTAGGELKALTATCTHQECTITGFQNATYVCPCHGSTYNTSGVVLGGPAPRSLRQYPSQFASDTLTWSA